MKKILLSVACSLFLSGSVLADDDFGDDKATGPNWNYIEGGGGIIDIHDSDITGYGFGIGGVVAPSKYIFIKGGILRAGDNSPYVNLNQTSFNIGGGFKYPVMDTIDIYVGASYLRTNFDDSANISGYSLGGGVRALFAETVELDVNVSRLQYGGYLGQTHVGGSLMYLFDHVGAGVELDFGGDQTSYIGKVRYSF